MNQLTRRQATRRLAGICLGTSLWTRHAAAVEAGDGEVESCTLGFGTYGLPDTSIAEALTLVSRAGYDSVEIAVMADRDAAPERLGTSGRGEVRRRLGGLGLRLTSLMENLSPLGDADRHRSDVERLRRAAELAHDLNPDDPPLVQSVLGGRDWAGQRNLCRDRLADWLQVAESTETVVCVKPHRSHAMSRPDEARWVLDELGRPERLRMVYDYSHYALRDMTLADTVAAALPITAHVAVKNVVNENGSVRFELPGQAGTIDYPALLRLLYEGGYRGDVCVEVSAQIWKQSDFNQQVALDTCYKNLSRAFERAEVPRPARA